MPRLTYSSIIDGVGSFIKKITSPITRPITNFVSRIWQGTSSSEQVVPPPLSEKSNDLLEAAEKQEKEAFVNGWERAKSATEKLEDLHKSSVDEENQSKSSIPISSGEINSSAQKTGAEDQSSNNISTSKTEVKGINVVIVCTYIDCVDEAAKRISEEIVRNQASRKLYPIREEDDSFHSKCEKYLAELDRLIEKGLNSKKTLSPPTESAQKASSRSGVNGYEQEKKLNSQRKGPSTSKRCLS